VTTFTDEAQALEIAQDSLYGLGAGVWTRDGNLAYRMGRGIKAGRVWTNCYHLYPAGAAFGGYKISGIGRENPPDDAGALLTNEEPSRELQHQAARVLLRTCSHDGPTGAPGIDATGEARSAIADLVSAGGPVMFFQSGGCL